MDSCCSYYTRVSTTDDKGKSTAVVGHSSDFPGSRRAVTNTGGRPLPSDMTFIKTGGNALQAVPRQSLEQSSNKDEELIAVSVPENHKGGDELLVKAPSDGRLIRVTIPEGFFPGRTFLVQAPPPPAATSMPMPRPIPPPTAASAMPQPQQQQQQQPIAAVGVPMEGSTNSTPYWKNPHHDMNNSNQTAMTPGPTKVVTGHDIESNNGDLFLHQSSAPSEHHEVELTNQQQQQQQQPATVDAGGNMVLVQVPAGAAPGSQICVQVPDGRTVEATVPPGNVTEFYMRLPPKQQQQNWHNNPVAVAPVTLAPFML